MPETATTTETLPARARRLRLRVLESLAQLPGFGPFADAKAAMKDLADMQVDMADQIEELRASARRGGKRG